MHMKRIVQVILLAALTLSMPVQAVRRYSCNFEDSIARSRWTLNPAANPQILSQITNRWYIGEPGNNDRNGHNGLYISADGGVTANYQNKGCWVFAYDTIALDPISGDYLMTFDYCVMANVASKFDGLYALWIPVTNEDGDTIKVNSIATSAGQVPARYIDYVIRLQPEANMAYLGGTVTWRQCAVKIPGSLCDGSLHYLAFAWANGSNQAQQPAAMVDNILISDGQPCPQPTNLVVTPNGTTVSLEWDGTATEYEVSAYSYDGQSWAGPKIVTGNQTNFTGLPIGQTDFIVRAKCDEDFFSLKTIASKLIYYPDQLCVDYLNLNNAVCYIDNSSPNNTLTFNDFKKVAPVDNGPSSIDSRHVVHFDRAEYEPRTGSMAKTVPDGELASVRLGNWDADNHAERIEFSFDVDTIKYPVLLLKYLPILEAPGHDDHENPRFKLDILIDGQSIGDCGRADFNANDVLVNGSGNVKPEYVQQGWHKTPHELSQTSADIVWKEWTTVGVNLRNKAYAGKTLTARLTTHDCTFSAHCGYAYFTLGCSDGKLKGMKCGEINPKFEAPDGFDYRWAYAYNEKYRRADGSLPEQYIIHRGKFYDAGYQDDSLYVVDCMFVQDSTCFFSLYASTLATNPISIMGEPVITKNCKQEKYEVTFDASRSWVQEIDHVTGDTLVSKNYHIETYEWNIEGLPYGWSDEVSPTFAFPSTGGDYRVSLRTTCGTCDSVLYYDLHLEPLGPTHETQTYMLCDDARKAGYQWKERTDTLYHTYGVVDSVVLYSETTSCDSIIYLELLEPVRLQHDTMIMVDDLPFIYHGRSYTVNTIDTIPNAACDTTWILNFEVYEPLIATMPNTSYVLCEGDPLLTLTYNITRGMSLRYSYTFTNPAIPSIAPVEDFQMKGHYEIPITIDPDLYPNIYQGSLLLEDSLPEHNVTIPFTVTMQYASSVIAQRWNDVLAIKNFDYNGGYVFDSVQWYVSGQPIVGAIDFNYFAGEESQLLFGQEYQALLTRNDGVKLFTCAYIPSPVSADVKDLPTLVPPSAPLEIKGKGTASWFDMLGRLYNSETFDDSQIRTPGTRGYFLLVLQTNNTRTIHRVVVR